MPLNFYEVYRVSYEPADEERMPSDKIGIGAYVAEENEGRQVVSFLIPLPDDYLGKPYRNAEGVLVQDDETAYVLEDGEFTTTLSPLTFEEWRAEFSTEQERLFIADRDEMAEYLRQNHLDDDWEERYGPT